MYYKIVTEAKQAVKLCCNIKRQQRYTFLSFEPTLLDCKCQIVANIRHVQLGVFILCSHVVK